MSDKEGTCPSGGSWYSCTAQSPTFFGCCTSNPCNGVGCPSGDLRAAGMGTSSGPDKALNDSSFWPNVQCSQGIWYTCINQSPSFQGCCGSNPCNGVGCPSTDLYAAAFSTLPATISGTAAVVTSTSSSSTTLTTSSSSSASPGSQLSVTSSPSQTGYSLASSSPEISASTSPSTNTSGIAGGVAAGAAILILVGIIIYFCRRRRQRKYAVRGVTGFPHQPTKDRSDTWPPSSPKPTTPSTIISYKHSSPPPSYRNNNSIPAEVHELQSLDAEQGRGLSNLDIARRRNEAAKESNRATRGSEMQFLYPYGVAELAGVEIRPETRQESETPGRSDGGRGREVGRGGYTSWQVYQEYGVAF